jgi:tRNA(fMet)-specific endonuclease VapC
MYLLDTNHCSYLLEKHPAITQKLVELGETPVATCVIVRGELMFMAYRSKYQTENVKRVKMFLHSLEVYPIDNQAAEVYGQLKAAILTQFGPREKAKRHKTTLPQLGFSENDLWIAAIAKSKHLILVSADRDFKRLSQVESLALENWMEER